MPHARGALDAIELPRLRRQSGATATVRAGVQPGQLPAAIRTAGERQTLDAHDAARQVDQDRREGRTSCPVRDISTGGGSRPASFVPSDPGADTAIRWDTAEGSSGTKEMRRLPTNSRHGTSDVDLCPASPKRVPTEPQDPFGGRNSDVSDPIPVRVHQIMGLVHRNGATIALEWPGDGAGEGQMGNVD